MSGTDLALYKQKMLAAAETYSEAEQITGGGFITMRGGILKVGEDVMPGNQILTIILDSIHENAVYEGDFDPNNMKQPVCYAMGRTESELGPHPDMQKYPKVFSPQSTDCASCPFNEWGSAEKGRGKACKNIRRLAVIPAGMFSQVKGTQGEFDAEVFDTEEHYRHSDMAFMKIPVTSTKAYSQYVQQLSKEYQLPPFGVFTRIYLVPDERSQYKVCFEALDVVPDELIPVIMSRHEEAVDRIIQPYQPFEEEAAPQSTGLKGLKRPG